MPLDTRLPENAREQVLPCDLTCLTYAYIKKYTTYHASSKQQKHLYYTTFMSMLDKDYTDNVAIRQLLQIDL